jgi:hypothetical protein
MDFSAAIGRLVRHRAWAAETLRWAHTQERDYSGLVEQTQGTIDVAEGVFQRAVMRAADGADHNAFREGRTE